MSARLFASGPLLLLLAACATPSATSGGPAPAAAPVSQPAPPAEQDRSLGLEQYVELGVPSPERTWSAQDYALAMKALSEIAQKDPAQLPRYQSERSGPLFARLTAYDNMDSLESLQLAPLAQVQTAGAMLGPASQILMLYLQAHSTSNSFATEMIELQAFTLHAAVAVLEAMDSVPRSEVRNRDAFESGLAQMQSGFGKMVSGALATLSEREVYSDEDRTRFLGRLMQDLPRLLPLLQPLTRREVPVRIDELLANERSPQVKRELESLRSAVAAHAN